MLSSTIRRVRGWRGIATAWSCVSSQHTTSRDARGRLLAFDAGNRSMLISRSVSGIARAQREYYCKSLKISKKHTINAIVVTEVIS